MDKVRIKVERSTRYIENNTAVKFAETGAVIEISPEAAETLIAQGYAIRLGDNKPEKTKRLKTVAV